jgi:hypothetical protein
MAESQELITLLNKKDSYSGLYNDIVKLSTFILDTYYFLGEAEVQKLDQPLKEIRELPILRSMNMKSSRAKKKHRRSFRKDKAFL